MLECRRKYISHLLKPFGSHSASQYWPGVVDSRLGSNSTASLPISSSRGRIPTRVSSPAPLIDMLYHTSDRMNGSSRRPVNNAFTTMEPPNSDSRHVTTLLVRWREGDNGAGDELLGTVY